MDENAGVLDRDIGERGERNLEEGDVAGAGRAQDDRGCQALGVAHLLYHAQQVGLVRAGREPDDRVLATAHHDIGGQGRWQSVGLHEMVLQAARDQHGKPLRHDMGR